MFEALAITLREGVEAALVLGIALALLRKRGLEHLRGALVAGTLAALAASVGVAALAQRVTWNEEIAEGVVMLIGALLVLSLTIWMMRAAPHMKQEIETGLARAAGRERGSAAGVFLFAFGMVFREGAETALFLSAAGFNSEGLGLWIGAALGLLLAAVFGVLFVRGSLRVPLKPFFTVTTAVLLLLAAQLLVGGLHELSEGGVLPATRQSMAIVGPLVKNELLLFTLTVALAAGWLLFGSRAAVPAPRAAAGPEARLALATRRQETALRRWTGIVAALIVGLLATAFMRSARVPGKPPASPVVAEAGAYSLDAAALADRKLHYYSTALDGREVRFFVVENENQTVACVDGCEICGDIGYFEDGVSVVCRNCTSPIVKSTLGRSGGCNPIPVPSAREGARLVVTENDLRAAFARIRGH